MVTSRAISVTSASWLTLLIPAIGIVLLFRVVTQDYFAMHTSPRTNLMACEGAETDSLGKVR